MSIMYAYRRFYSRLPTATRLSKLFVETIDLAERRHIVLFTFAFYGLHSADASVQKLLAC